MLIEFRASNFRSIQGELVLSMVATSDKQFIDTNTVKTELRGIDRLLRAVAIFGANGSGKSNILLALESMQHLVAASAARFSPGQQLPYQPFALGESPCEFTEYELTFIHDGVRHQYGFKHDQARIVEEWLLVYVSSKPQTWFFRTFDHGTQKYAYRNSDFLKGKKELWQEATRENALFLSTAAQLNSEQLLPIFRWITEDIVILAGGHSLSAESTLEKLQSPEEHQLILNLLSAADFGICEVDVTQRKVKAHGIEIRGDGTATFSTEDKDEKTPIFSHRTASGAITKFPLEQESLGTQRFFLFAGPLIDILRRGKVLVVDELDNSMHTLLCRRIIELFQVDGIGGRAAQLVFTTHDTSLLDAYGLLRRDQVWLAKKSSSGQNSELVPLTDYMPRKGEALERGYISGRYGGTPTLDVDLFARVRDATQSDRTRININEPYEVRYWSNSLGVDADGLRRAVNSVGNVAADVRNFIVHGL